ncbi:serine/arginine repetitive matrix protein 2-like [Amphibalanus amphitrite]|uniref:serine/arginine repetitive matrix protein 2-like n=1 Tax=Amphibalanus amphitrite TaxID=1232801 RepID=UPI001C900C23|nr:serine/arginine repetitive matrix protein 2-like [Amphibalanus amphitrite]XP_043220261.1 serine/arginine repetitive matrix protein 2-like [Amphibalanus amphitrite]
MSSENQAAGQHWRPLQSTQSGGPSSAPGNSFGWNNQMRGGRGPGPGSWQRFAGPSYQFPFRGHARRGPGPGRPPKRRPPQFFRPPQSMWAQQIPFRPPFPGIQSHIDFTSDSMCDDSGSFMPDKPPNWQLRPPQPPQNHPPHQSLDAPFYRREKQVPTTSNTNSKKKKKKLSTPPKKASSAILIRASERQKARHQAAVRVQAAPKASPGNSAKKNGKTPATKKTKKAPVKSAEQVAEETRLKAMKTTANKIKTLLKKPKPAAAAAGPSSAWLNAPEQESAAGASGPRLSRNLLGELEFSSTDWQAIGSGGLGARGAAEEGEDRETEDDDQVEIIEQEVREPEVISIAGEEESDEEEEDDGKQDDEVVDELVDAEQPREESGSAASSDDIPSEIQTRDGPCADQAEDVDSCKASDALSAPGGDPLVMPLASDAGALSAATAVDCAPRASSDTCDGAAQSSAVTVSNELDEFDAADVTMTGRSGGRRPADRLKHTSSVPSPAVPALDGGESDSSGPAPSPLRLPRLEESPTRAPEADVPSGSASAAPRTASPLSRSSPRLSIKRRRYQGSVRRGRGGVLATQRGGASALLSAAECVTSAEFQPVVRIKREPGLDGDAISGARGALTSSSETATPSRNSPAESRAESPTVVGVLWTEQPASGTRTPPPQPATRAPTPPPQPPVQPSPVRRPRKPRSKPKATPPSKKTTLPAAQPAPKEPASRTSEMPVSQPIVVASEPDKDAVVFISPSADMSSAATVSSPAHGRKRRVSDTQTSPNSQWRLPVPSKRVRSNSECSALEEPVSSRPRPAPTSGATSTLIRRLMRMGKESLRTAVDDPTLLRSRHLISELMRTHRGQQARRMEQERFAVGGSGGGGSPARRDTEETLPAEVLSDIQKILEKGAPGEDSGPLLTSSPVPTGLLSAERLGVAKRATGREPVSTATSTQPNPTFTASSVAPLGGSGRGRVAQSVAAAFARRASEAQKEKAATEGLSRPDESPVRIRPSTAAAAAPARSSPVRQSSPDVVAVWGGSRTRADSDPDIAEVVTVSRPSATSTATTSEDRSRFAALNGSARFSCLDGSSSRPGSAVSASVQGRARSPPRVVVSAAAAGAQRGKAPLPAAEPFSGPPPSLEPRSIRPNVGGGRPAGGGRKPWECRSCFSQSWTNTCRIFNRHTTVIEKDVYRLADELSSREPAWDNMLHLSLVENQLLGQVEEMEEQILALQTEMRRLRQIARHMRDVRLKCMSSGRDVQPGQFGLPPEVQQLLRRLAEHAPGAAEGPADGGQGDGPGRGTGEGEGESREELERRPESGDAARTTDGGPCDRVGGEDSCNSAGNVASAAAAAAPTASSATEVPPLPGGVRVKQEPSEPAPSDPSPATAPTETEPPSSPPRSSPPPSVPPTAAVKPDPAAAGDDGMEVDEDEVSLARAIVRVRNESELNEMAAALLSAPLDQDEPEDPPVSERQTSQESYNCPPPASAETGGPAAMSYLGQIDSSSELYKSLLELAKHNGNTVMLRVTPEGTAVPAGEGERREEEGERDGEEPRMSVAEMAAVKMEVGEYGVETAERGETTEERETNERGETSGGRGTEKDGETTKRRKGRENTTERKNTSKRKDTSKGRKTTNGRETTDRRKTADNTGMIETTDEAVRIGEVQSVSETRETERTEKAKGDPWKDSDTVVTFRENQGQNEAGSKRKNEDESNQTTDKCHDKEESHKDDTSNPSSYHIHKSKKKKKKHKKHRHAEGDSSSSAPSGGSTPHDRRRAVSAESTADVRRAPSSGGDDGRRAVSECSEGAPPGHCGQRTISQEEGAELPPEADIVATRTRLDDLGVPIVSVQLHGSYVFVLTSAMVLHRYTLSASYVRSLCSTQVVCDTISLWSAPSSLPRPRPTCMAVKKISKHVSVLIGDDTGSLTILAQVKPDPPLPPPALPGSESSDAAANTSTFESHSVRRVHVGSTISCLSHKANRLYIGGDAFFAVVNAERLLALKTLPEEEGRPLPLRFWPPGDVLLSWHPVQGDVGCVRPFHLEGSCRVALTIRGRCLQVRDGLDGELLSTVGSQVADQGCHLAVRWGHALHTLRPGAPAVSTRPSCCLSVVDLEKCAAVDAGYCLKQAITALDADGDHLYVGHQDGSLRVMVCAEKTDEPPGGESGRLRLRSVRQLRGQGSSPLQTVAARADKVITGSSTGLVEMFVLRSS